MGEIQIHPGVFEVDCLNIGMIKIKSGKYRIAEKIYQKFRKENDELLKNRQKRQEKYALFVKKYLQKE